MNPLAILIVVSCSIAILTVPKKWAPAPLIVGSCYLTGAQGIDLGIFYFSVLRILVAVGVIRIIIRGEGINGGLNGLDGLMILFAFFALLSSPFHENAKDALVFRLGLVYGTCGIYFLTRCFCQTREDAISIIKITIVILVPIALEMLNEQLTGRNWFSFMGGVPESVVMRKGSLRAQGPFAHAILAGTVGAVFVPLTIGIWKHHPRIAKIGLCSCMLITLASRSSGPMMSMIFSIVALLAWRWRHLAKHIPIGLFIGYIILDIVMKAPAYYIIAKIDLTGGSTGYHRARLIQMGIEHFDEWWFFGSDYTRHWMPYGVSWNEDHVDITNQYLYFGVLGGLPLMVLFILAFVTAFRYIGKIINLDKSSYTDKDFFIWSFGASLFAHAATCISVSYFDQSFIFIYITFGLISSLKAMNLSDVGKTQSESNFNYSSTYSTV